MSHSGCITLLSDKIKFTTRCLDYIEPGTYPVTVTLRDNENKITPDDTFSITLEIAATPLSFNETSANATNATDDDDPSFSKGQGQGKPGKGGKNEKGSDDEIVIPVAPMEDIFNRFQPPLRKYK